MNDALLRRRCRTADAVNPSYKKIYHIRSLERKIAPLAQVDIKADWRHIFCYSVPRPFTVLHRWIYCSDCLPRIKVITLFNIKLISKLRKVISISLNACLESKIKIKFLRLMKNIVFCNNNVFDSKIMIMIV